MVMEIIWNQWNLYKEKKKQLQYMSQFKEFKAKFDKLYKALDSFIYVFEEGNNPLELALKSNLDKEEYNSYGYEDSVLKRVFYSKEFDIFVMFSGTRQSYQGEEWNEMKEVKPITKTIEVYE